MIVMSIIVSQTVISASLCQPMSPCDHENNNTIICAYLKDAMEKGDRKVLQELLAQMRQ